MEQFLDHAPDASRRLTRTDDAEARLGILLTRLPPAEGLKRLLRLRAQRRARPHGQFLGGPAWDMLLDLAAVPGEGGHVSVSAICISSGAPQSTALRKLAALEGAGLVRRYLHRTDRRRVCLALTGAGEALVAGTLREEVEVLAGFSEARPRGSAPDPAGPSRPSR